MRKTVAMLKRGATAENVAEQVAKVKKVFQSPLLPPAFQQLHAETQADRQRKRRHLGNAAWFNLLIGVMLCVNTIVVGIETDYSRGRQLEDRLAFFVIETLFAVTFFTEVMIRMHHLGWEYAIDPWNIFDYSLVVFGWTDVLVSVTDTGSGGMRLASSLRLFRLLRVVRSIRGIKVLAGLWVVIQGLLDSYRTVLWVAFAMAIFLFCFGAAVCVLGGQDRFAFEHWYMGHMYVGSVLRSMFTMLQVATFDKWAESVARPLFHVAPMATPVLFVCIFVMSFGTLNILVAVMVERISVITADRRTHAEQARVRMEAYMLESMVDDLHANDKDGSGDLSQKEFKKIIRIPGLVKKLGLLGITIEEAESLFEIMDVNHSGTVTPEEFIAGLQKIKGQAKGQDMVQLICYAQRQVVRSAQYVSRMKFLNMQVDHVQERLNASGISLQFESGDRIKTAERNEMVTTSAAHRELLLFKLDAERQSAYPVVQDVRPGIDDDYDWS
ncbi:Cation channel sperm-associated protein 1 (CatSper1) [Durusdinium trenchii]|uniref:Cation channel sperm-associated protein 1 (CatSper1) n=1 Tax=Durusdinium trenchii TaxID=1381693 RepID=A0ABP0QYK1_9DINO